MIITTTPKTLFMISVFVVLCSQLVHLRAFTDGRVKRLSVSFGHLHSLGNPTSFLKRQVLRVQ